MSPEHNNPLLSHAEVSLLRIVFGDSKVDRNGKSNSDTSCNIINNVRLKVTNNLNEERLRCTRYVLFV